ncbi:MAG TPA: histidine phosphatase family protein [Candidatus Saccharimonadales bacterium]|nr:histidine phosphatase family protein [Candidatus Saccharimonadales bacterium]
MSVLVVRHGLSEANNRDNIGTLAFASDEAPLMEQGRQQARLLGETLTFNYGVEIGDTEVATSTLYRTQETAREAGFKALKTYAVLDEVLHGIELPQLREMLDKKQLPPAAIEAAENIIENPPSEPIWFTHGLVIAGLCQVMGVAEDQRFIPRFCEVRQLPI